MFETNDKIYFLKKLENEGNTIYYTKCKFISHCNLKNNSLDYYIKMANIYVNTKFYGCEYDQPIINELNKIIS
jgi:hypothetical protein